MILFNNCFNLFFEMSVYFNESFKLHLCSLLMTINGYIFFFFLFMSHQVTESAWLYSSVVVCDSRNLYKGDIAQIFVTDSL